MTQGIIITTCQQKPNIHSFKECLIVNFVISESPILPNHKNTRSILTYYLICNLCSQFSQYFFCGIQAPSWWWGETGKLPHSPYLSSSPCLSVSVSASVPLSVCQSLYFYLSTESYCNFLLACWIDIHN